MTIGRDTGGLLHVMSLPLIGILSALILPSMHGRGLWAWFGVSIITGLVAVGLLAYARLPLYRQGKFLSMGPKELEPDRLPIYKWAWRLIVFTVCLQVFLLMMVKSGP